MLKTERNKRINASRAKNCYTCIQPVGTLMGLLSFTFLCLLLKQSWNLPGKWLQWPAEEGT